MIQHVPKLLCSGSSSQIHILSACGCKSSTQPVPYDSVIGLHLLQTLPVFNMSMTVNFLFLPEAALLSTYLLLKPLSLKSLTLPYAIKKNLCISGVPKLGAASPWCAARLCQRLHESCSICHGCPRIHCLVSSLLCTTKLYGAKILSGRLCNNCSLRLVLLQFNSLNCILVYSNHTSVKITHSVEFNNISSKSLTIYWIRNGRICYQ